MADDRYRRTDGASAAVARGSARPEPSADPLVELARLIGQNDPVAYEPRSAQRSRDGVESRVERAPAPQRRSEPAPAPASRAPEPKFAPSSYTPRSPAADPSYSEQRYSEPGQSEPRFSDPRSDDHYSADGYDERDAEPPFEAEPRYPDQRYDGYTEPPRPSDARRVDPPAWLSSPRAPEPIPEPRASAPRAAEPRMAEPQTGWKPPRPRDAAPRGSSLRDPVPTQPAADPGYDDGYVDPHGGRPLGDRYGAAEPMFPTQAESLELGRDEQNYDPRYAPAADGAFESGDYYDPERGGEPYGRYAGQDADEQDDARPQGRGRAFAIAAAIMALAVVGTAGAYGYRTMKGGGTADGSPPVIRADVSPKKIASAVQSGDKQIYERIGSQNERMVSREEQPVAIRDPGGYPDATSNLPPTVSAPATVPSATPGEPKKIRTVTIRPDGEPPAAAKPATPAAAVPAAARPAPARPAAPAAGNAPMAITPAAPAPAARPAPQTAMATPAPSAAESGNYVVQLSAQKTPEEARASFRAMQDKYPSVLSNRQVLVKKKDLGAKGIYYGSQVGPFASREDAVQLCESLKSAGGNCIVQRN